WNQKTQSANSTLIKYRDMSGMVATYCLILGCQKEKDSEGVIEFVNNCYENEKNIMATQIPVPTFIAKRYLNPKTNPESKPNADKTRPPFSAASGKVSVDGSWSKLTNNPDPELGLKPETPDVAITIHDGSAEKSDGEKNSNEGKHQLAKIGASLNEMTHSLSRTLSQLSVEKFLRENDNNVKTQVLLNALLMRYRNLKWLYGRTAKYYYTLNLAWFYSPLLILGTLNTILTSVIIGNDGDTQSQMSLLVIKVSTVVSILTGLQLTLQWESESSKCYEAHQLYRKLGSETSYRLMLSKQGVSMKNTAEFAWKCREVEEQTVDTAPAVPKYIQKKIRKMQKSHDGIEEEDPCEFNIVAIKKQQEDMAV
ncbi:uncharacterized protein LOC142356012, partial [Convolutriloba macropyga]